MVDTPRTSAALVTAAADNTTGNYTPQNLRDLIVSVHNVVPTVVAAAGTTQGTAAVLTAHTNIVTLCASGAGVMATAGYTKIYSRGANDVLVYPISGAKFEGLATNAPVTVPVGGQAEFFMTSSTQGYVG